MNSGPESTCRRFPNIGNDWNRNINRNGNVGEDVVRTVKMPYNSLSS